MFVLLRDIDVLIIKLTGYRFFYVVADFGACLFVKEFLAAADDDDDTEDHQKECDDQLETFNRTRALNSWLALPNSGQMLV